MSNEQREQEYRFRELLMRENAPRGPLYTIEPGFHRPKPRQSWHDPRHWAGLECVGGPACDHEPRGYYSYATTDSAWQALGARHLRTAD